MSKPMERLGRVDHPLLGKSIKVRYWTWDGERGYREDGTIAGDGDA